MAIYNSCKYLYTTDIKNYVRNITLAPRKSTLNKYAKNFAHCLF